MNSTTKMSNSQERTDTPVSLNNGESATPTGSPLSEYQPMEDVTSEISMTVSSETTDDLIQTAQANLETLKNQYSILFGHYLSYQRVNPDSDNTKNSFAICKEAEQKYVDAKTAFSIFKSIHNPVKMQDDKKFSLVPSSLPFLQLKTDIVLYKKIMKSLTPCMIFVLNFKQYWKLIL